MISRSRNRRGAVPSHQPTYGPRSHNPHEHHHDQYPNTTQSPQSPPTTNSPLPYLPMQSHKPSFPITHHRDASWPTPSRIQRYLDVPHVVSVHTTSCNVHHIAPRRQFGQGGQADACCAACATGLKYTGVLVDGDCGSCMRLVSWGAMGPRICRLGVRGWWFVMGRTEGAKGIRVLSSMCPPSASSLVPVLTPPLARPGPGGVGLRCRQDVTAGGAHEASEAVMPRHARQGHWFGRFVR